MLISDFAKTILANNSYIIFTIPHKKLSLMFYPEYKGIFIPSMTIDEYYKKEIDDTVGRLAVKVIEDMLIRTGSLCYGQHLNSIGLIAFYLLHEEGHLIHFTNEYLHKHKSHQDYYDDYEKQRILLEETFFNEFPDCITNEEIHRWHELYRENGFEKIADIYAIDKICKNSDLKKFFLSP